MTDASINVPLEELDAFQVKMQEISRTAGSFSSTLSAGLKAALVDGKSLESVFRQIALSASSSVLRAALKPLDGLAQSLLGSAFGGLVGGLGGSATSLLQSVTPFAQGGVIASPTYFGLGGNGTGGSGGLGLAGEAGAEAVLPLVRGSDGRLGVQNGPGAAAQPRVQVNIAARDVESFRRSEAQVSALVARAVGRGRRGL